ncbi:MAG: hypothetical protein ABL907_20610, partial [Hyphomicrobium sp.]
MATERDLFLSILALDAYNRGYNPGITGLSEAAGNQIGNATIALTTEDQFKSVSFYAAAYDWNGQTVISYRGTTFEAGPNLGDILYGWTLSAGYGSSAQPQLAKEFYNQVTGLPIYGPPSADVVLTGHSLGGGLAAFVASLSGSKADIFNNIAFGTGVVADIAGHNFLQGFSDFSGLFSGTMPSGNYVGLPTSSNNIRQFITTGEVATLSRGFSPVFSAAVFGPIFGPVVAGLAVGTGTVLELSTAYQYMNSNAGYFFDPIKLHSQSLITMLIFADVNGNVDWADIGAALNEAYFNPDIGKAIGFTAANVGGWYGYEAKVLATIAYSAVDVSSPAGGKPFGDSAIRALFDDADQLGRIYKNAPADPMKSAQSGLASIAVQFAGDLAFQKATDADTKKGIFELTDGDKKLKADLDPQKWVSTFNIGSVPGADGANQPRTGGQEKIVGLSTLVTALVAASVAEDATRMA